jgi:hypothetical protein
MGREANSPVRLDGEEVMENMKSLVGEVGEFCRLGGGDRAAKAEEHGGKCVIPIVL